MNEKENYCVLSGFLEAKSGKEGMLKTELNALVQASLKEEGCIQYTLHQSLNNPRQFMFYEVWKNLEAFEAHSISSHIVMWREKKGQLLEKPNEILFWKII